jgi:hypothetical protein
MNELKVYTNQTTIFLYNWVPVITTADKDKIAQAINSWAKMIEINWDYIASSNISQITSDKIWEVESFVLNFDKDVQKRLRRIMKVREEKWLKINIEILKNAYKNTYNEDIFNS